MTYQGKLVYSEKFGAQLCVFRFYAEPYRNRMPNKYLNKIGKNILIK